MSYAIVGILVIAFIAFVILSAKAWHWSNIVFLTLCFLAGLGGLIAMSQVLDARRSDMLEAQKFERDLKQVEEQIETTVYGSGFSFEYAPESLRGLSEALSLELAGQGRVWRSGVIEAMDTNRVFKFAGERAMGTDNPAKMEDMLLYVFTDRQFENEEIYPVSFVGMMRVVSETSNSVELEPEFISDHAEFENPSSTWTLFEKSPSDQRDAYARDSEIVIDVKDPQLNENLTLYRAKLEEEYLPAELFEFDLSNDQQARDYEFFIDRMMFDGLPLVKIESWIETQTERVSQRFDPPNEEVFVRYRFDNKSNRAYQVDSDGNIETDGRFTQNGQAVDPALHAGSDIEFQKDDEIMVDQLTADGYQRGEDVVPRFPDTEPVTELERLYVRQLSDFPFLLKTLRRQSDEYTTEIARIEANNARSQQAITNAQQQSNDRDVLVDHLLADQEKFETDLNIVNLYVDSVRLKKSDIEMKIREIGSEVRNRHRKIKAIATTLASPVTSVLPLESLPVQTFGSPTILPPVSAPPTTPGPLPATDLSPAGVVVLPGSVNQ